MKRFLDQCRGSRQSICLLASGALSEQEEAQIQSHLALCPACRNYFAEIKAVTEPLGNWEKSFAHVQPAPSLQMRWANVIQRWPTAKAPQPLSIQGVFQRFWHELLLPLRWHLAGMAALWMIVAILNVEPSSAPVPVAQNKSSAREVLMALRENRRQVAELINPPATESAPLPEVFVPRRRSEIQLPTAMA